MKNRNFILSDACMKKDRRCRRWHAAVPFLKEEHIKELLIVFCYSVSSCTAGDKDLNNGISAKSVSAMDAAGHFAGSVQSGNDLSICIQNMTILVNGDAAHRMMGRRCQQTYLQLDAIQCVC